MTFEAPRELLDPATRDRTLQEIRDFGVDRVRVLVYWRDFAPAPNVEAAPAPSTPPIPDAYPAGAWDRLDGLFAAPQARGIAVQLTLTGPVPRWATASKRDNVTRPSAKEFQAFATAVGRRYGDRVGHVVDLERAQPPAVPAPAVRQAEGEVAAHLPQALPRRPARPARRPGNGADTLLFGETAPRGTPRVVAPLAFLRGALCLNRSYKPQGQVRAHRRRRLRAPRLHDARRPALPPAGPRRRDDRRALAADHRARPRRQGGRDHARPRDLPDRVRHPEHARPVSACRSTQQAEYLAIAEHMAFVNPRVKSFSQYLLRDDQPRKARSRVERYGGFESGLRRADGRAKPSYDAFRLPLAAEAYGPSDVLWGRVRPLPATDPGHDPRLAAQGQAVQAAAHAPDQPPRRLRAAREAPRQAALPRALDRAGRQGLARAADPRHQVSPRTVPRGPA